MSRWKGNELPTLTFKNGAASTVDLSQFVTNFEVADGDGSNATFGDWAAGKAPKACNITFVLDPSTNGPIDYFDANKGATGVTMTYVRNSANSVSADNRKWTATVQMPFGTPNFAVSQQSPTDTDQTFQVSVQCGTTLATATS